MVYDVQMPFTVVRKKDERPSGILMSTLLLSGIFFFCDRKLLASFYGIEPLLFFIAAILYFNVRLLTF